MNTALRLARGPALAIVTLAIAGQTQEAWALAVQFSTTSDTQTYFAGQPYEIKAGFTGSGGAGCCVAWEGFQFSPRIQTSIDLTEGVPLNLAVNKPTSAHPSAGWPGAGTSGNETHTLSYVFELLSPNVVGPNSVTFDMDMTVSFSSLFDFDPPTAIFYRYGPNNQPLTHTFDLGADGLLDVTFDAVNSISTISTDHIGHANTGIVTATFLLHDVPDAVPEPATMLLFGAGLLAVPALTRRRKHGGAG